MFGIEAYAAFGPVDAFGSNSNESGFITVDLQVSAGIIDAIIDTPRVRAARPDSDPSTYATPSALAESYWSLYTQHPAAWTHELDLRPASEKF
jgi:hypothetical protein